MHSNTDLPLVGLRYSAKPTKGGLLRDDSEES